jgi:hypothetical protein
VVSPESVHVDRIVGNAAGTRIRLTAEEVTATDGLSQPGWLASDRRAASVRFHG